MSCRVLSKVQLRPSQLHGNASCRIVQCAVCCQLRCLAVYRLLLPRLAHEHLCTRLAHGARLREGDAVARPLAAEAPRWTSDGSRAGSDDHGAGAEE